MAELDIGTHCSVKECKQLDFLPVPCEWCSSVFCKIHGFPENHNCSKVNLKVAVGNVSMKGHDCDFPGCTLRELTPVICPTCAKNFCLMHRHQADHKCEKMEVPKERMQRTREHVQKIIAKNATTKPLGRGKTSKSTAAKVALMKMKMKATGPKAIPDEEKLFLSIDFPESCQKPPKAIFVSKKWSVGKLIDYAADVGGIKNMNNQSVNQRLHLFHKVDGEHFPANTVLETLETNQLPSGSSVVIEICDV